MLDGKNKPTDTGRLVGWLVPGADDSSFPFFFFPWNPTPIWLLESPWVTDLIAAPQHHHDKIKERDITKKGKESTPHFSRSILKCVYICSIYCFCFSDIFSLFYRRDRHPLKLLRTILTPPPPALLSPALL